MLELNDKHISKIGSSNWTCVDGLGRVLSTSGEVRSKQKDRFAVIFYWTQHGYWSQIRYARNVSNLLNSVDAQTREAARNDYNHPLWSTPNPAEDAWYWDEPLVGYYNTYDPYVIRKHAELLADAGVDMIAFDFCIGINTVASYQAVFQGFSEARKDGVNAPKIGFVLPMGNAPQCRDLLMRLYDEFYKKGLYQDSWFYLEDEHGIRKPLIFAWPDNLDVADPYEAEVRNFFTYRKCDAYTWRSGDAWDIIASKNVSPTQFENGTPDVVTDKGGILSGWLNNYPQTKYYYTDGTNVILDSITVGVAQNVDVKKHASTAMNGFNPAGRSYVEGDYSYSYMHQGKEVKVSPEIPNAVYYGLNFQQQWDYAIEADPRFVFITGWNEWTMGRYPTFNFTGNGGDVVYNAFVDQFNEEYSRDCEPSKGILKDYYYCQLVENIRRFKGLDAQPLMYVHKSIDINGDVDQWNDVDSFEHYTGSTKYRAFNGCIGHFYQNNTMRNDIVRAKATYDQENIYFYVETSRNLTPETDPAWMRLLICTDLTESRPNWEGFNYIVNRKLGVLERSQGDWIWEEVAPITYKVLGKILQMVIPRKLLGFADTIPDFHFKWSDNMQKDGDIMDFYVNGDVAPGGRFMFHFQHAK